MADRKSKYSKAMALRICDGLREGKSMRVVCAPMNMPYPSTVYRWLALPSNTWFRDQYTRARQDSTDAMLEDILDIADDGTNDTYVDDQGNVRTDTDVVQRSKLRIDARKWSMAHLQPKKYGEKLDLSNTDGSLSKPVLVYQMTPDKLPGDIKHRKKGGHKKPGAKK